MRRTYAQFVGAMLLLLVPAPEWLRLVYLHGGTAAAALCEPALWPSASVAIVHSVIHNLWPFLTARGYDRAQSPLADVLCHFVMMAAAWRLTRASVAVREGRRLLYDALSVGFLAGSLVNCWHATRLRTDADFERFGTTAAFQAVSTGYWVAAMLWWRRWHRDAFLLHWAGWIGGMVLNWHLYRKSPSLLGFSMVHRYVEGVHMACLWPVALRLAHL